MIVGDLNERIGRFQNSVSLLSNSCNFKNVRDSLDYVLNANGKLLVSLIEDFSFLVVNEVTNSDSKG